MKYNNKYQINLSDLFDSKDDFLKECSRVNKEIDKIKKYKNHVLDNENKLCNTLELDRDISCYLERLYIYAKINNDLDLSNSEGNMCFSKVISLYNKYASVASFVVPELLKKDLKYIKKLISKNDKLLEFEHNLKEIYRTKKHILSNNEEKILSSLNSSVNTPMEVFTKLVNVDLKFNDIKDENGDSISLTNSNYDSFLELNNSEVRRNAFFSMHNGFKSINSTASSLLNREINNHNTISSIRKYSSALECSLDKNNINTTIYESLIKAVNKKIKVLHKEWELKKKILNIDDYHVYDMSLSIVPENNKIYDIEEARDLIQGSLLIMGKEYSEAINNLFSKNLIDIYPRMNKRNGAYATCSYLTHPYVFVNYNGTMHDVLTVTHELGHAMHYYYAKNNNTFTNYSYSIFVAEVASQVNEILLLKYMLNKTSDKKEKLYLLDKFLRRFKLTFATMYADFERKLHEYDQSGVYLGDELINKEYLNIHKKYYGPSVIVDDEVKYGWSRTPMFFHNYYLYQYATGYAAALEIAENIFNKKDKALANYIEFLKLGSTKDPVSSLKVAGVDITGTKIYYNAIKIFDKTLDKIEKLYYSEEEINE